MINILVSGGNGQLAKNIRDVAVFYSELNFIYKDVDTLDITNLNSLEKLFQEFDLNYCINCAAFTAVDSAEENHEIAYDVNQTGARNLAKTCFKYSVALIHISTDFVFNGRTFKAYTEKDKTDALSVYGKSKLKGEQAIQEVCNRYFIIRTSWLYSEHNNNFMKTMLHLSESRDELSIIDDQIGTPTYAKDLAKVIFEIIDSKNKNYGIYHYSNEGVASWYDFAVAIFAEAKVKVKVSPIKTENYPTPAKRPTFSVLDKTKIKKNLNIKIPHWRNSLNLAILNLKKLQKNE